MSSPIGYVAYIDEAGDDGLYRTIRPDDPQGVSEWMVMSAVVVRIENDRNVTQWVRDIITKLKQPQLTHLHFRRLQEAKKAIVCEELAKLPVRCFVVLSHNRNMINLSKINRWSAGSSSRIQLGITFTPKP